MRLRDARCAAARARRAPACSARQVVVVRRRPRPRRARPRAMPPARPSAGRGTAPRWRRPAGTAHRAGRWRGAKTRLCRSIAQRHQDHAATAPRPASCSLSASAGAARGAVALAGQVDRRAPALVARQPARASPRPAPRRRRRPTAASCAPPRWRVTDQPVCGGSMKTRSKCSNQRQRVVVHRIGRRRHACRRRARPRAWGPARPGAARSTPSPARR